MKHFLSINDINKKEVLAIFRETDRLMRVKEPLLKNRTLAMIFEKSSTRTRISFEVAMEQLGGHAIFLSTSDLQLARGETIGDTGRVLSRYIDCIMARVFGHDELLELAKYATVPVINGLSDYEHPCQALTDAYTIFKNRGLSGKIVLLGDGGNNTFVSLIKLLEMFGMEIVVSCPADYQPTIAGKYKIIEDPKEAVKGANVLYTDTFVSMGKEKEREKRINELQKYQLDASLLALADNPIVLHPLPAHRGIEIIDEVMDGKNSIVFDQAENRLHVQKALLYLLLMKWL